MIDYAFGAFMFVLGLGYGLALGYKRNSDSNDSFVSGFYKDALDRIKPGQGVQLFLTVEKSRDDDDDDFSSSVGLNPIGSRWENN